MKYIKSLTIVMLAILLLVLALGLSISSFSSPVKKHTTVIEKIDNHDYIIVTTYDKSGISIVHSNGCSAWTQHPY